MMGIAATNPKPTARVLPPGYIRIRELLLCFTLAFAGMGLSSISIREQFTQQPKQLFRFFDEPSPIIKAPQKKRPDRSASKDHKLGETAHDNKTKVLKPIYAPGSNSHEQNPPWPKVVWLMSFPNSGTSFTSKLIKKVTKSRTASNYGKSNYDASGWSVPIHAGDYRGPFFVDPPKNHETLYENEFIMTKTHCGGYCQNCRPKSYDMTAESFEASCLKSHRVWIEDGKKVYEQIVYPGDFVKKAIHVIRDPFDNIVSRFHLEIHEYKKIHDVIPPYLENSKAGFRLFCNEMEMKYSLLEDQSELWQREGMDTLKAEIPCYADFFKWVQWHNLANQLTKEMEIPTYVLNYEKFDGWFEESLDEILEFLGQGRKGKPDKFIKGKAYKEYFRPKELKNVRAAMKHLATNETWSLIKHYFQ